MFFVCFFVVFLVFVLFFFVFHLLSTQRKGTEKECPKNAKKKRRNENCIFQITQVVLSFSANDHNHSTSNTCCDCSKKQKSSKGCSSSLSTRRSSESESRVCSLTALKLIKTLSFENLEVLYSFYGNEFRL